MYEFLPSPRRDFPFSKAMSDGPFSLSMGITIPIIREQTDTQRTHSPVDYTGEHSQALPHVPHSNTLIYSHRLGTVI